MSLQIHPLVTVKKAATALGVDREVLRNMIDIGAVRAERRFVKNKEKWFLYQEEVQEYLEKRAQELSEQATRTTMEGLGEFFEPEDAAAQLSDDGVVDFSPEANSESTIFDRTDIGLSGAQIGLSGATDQPQNATDLEMSGVELELSGAELEINGIELVTEVGVDEEDHPDRMYLQTAQHSLDQMLHSLTIEFAHRLCEERQIICNLKQQLDEKNQLLSGIPDLRQKLDEVKFLQQSRDAEIAALKANITALESDLSWWKKPWWNRLFSSSAKA